MEQIKPNLECEERLLKLFSYNLICPNNSNRWLIFDEDINEVGFIQYKKIKSKNVKKEYQQYLDIIQK